MGSVGLITYAHEDGPIELNVNYIDGATIEKLAIKNAANYSLPGSMVIGNTRYVQAKNGVASLRWISYVGVLFS